jgi:hypothetical protein
VSGETCDCSEGVGWRRSRLRPLHSRLGLRSRCRLRGGPGLVSRFDAGADVGWLATFSTLIGLAVATVVGLGVAVGVRLAWRSVAEIINVPCETDRIGYGHADTARIVRSGPPGRR